MIKVRATSASRIYNKALKEFHRIVEEGEVFELTEERFNYLNGNNRFNVIFVEPVDAKLDTKPTKKIKIAPVVTEEPDIFIIEPGKDPVQVDENLKPIEKKAKKSKSKKNEVDN